MMRALSAGTAVHEARLFTKRMTRTAACPSRELDRRTAGGVNVRVLWSPIENRVTVTVHDAVTGDRFYVEALPTDGGYEVF